MAKPWQQYLKDYLLESNSWLPGVAAALISLGIGWQGGWQPLEQLSYNTLFQIRPQRDWHDRIRVIAIDETSLEAYGQFPWSRDRYVKLLQSLTKSSPAAVGFDILFIDPSPLDSQLVNAIAASKKTVLAVGWDDQGFILEPLPALRNAAASTGHILHNPDGDGISRQATIFVESQPMLGLALLKLANQQQNPVQQLQLPEPKGNKQLENAWINWPGKTEKLPTYSFVDVAEGRIDPSALTDKFVLVGFTATGLDPLRTPFNSNPPTAGVYLHAALIDNILNDRLLKYLSPELEILLILLIGPAASWILSKLTFQGRLGLGLLLPPAWFAIALGVFTWGNWWIPIAAPVGTILLAGVGVQLREQYEKQQLMRLFAQHVAPEMAKLIWQRKAEIFEKGELEAQELTATVLFMDIRGFTTISESLPPRELLSWLNLYLDQMARCIMKHGGVIDKYIGDAIMAVFGIPFPQTEETEIQQDALKAIAASLEMHHQLQQLNEHLKAQGKPLIKIGIGIHTGSVVAGTVGGAERLSYSIIGDTVNVAARLESMNKQLTANLPYHILVSGKTYEYVRDRYRVQEAGHIQLRGKESATMVYAILGNQEKII